MSIENALASVAVTNLDSAVKWYERGLSAAAVEADARSSRMEVRTGRIAAGFTNCRNARAPGLARWLSAIWRNSDARAEAARMDNGSKH